MKRMTTKQKIALILFGLFLCTVLLETGLRIGGFIILSLQEYKNKISLKKNGYRILCLGESTTQGGYCKQLNLILNDIDSTRRFSVINKGIGGTNTGIIVTRLESYLEKYKPDIVITMMGINDKHISVKDVVGDIFKEKEDERIYNVDALRIYKLFKLLKLHINEKIKEIGYKEAESFGENETKEEIVDESKSLKETEEMLKKAIEINPINEVGYFKLGWLYKEQMKYKESEEMLKKAIEINPILETGYVNLGIFYKEQMKYKESEEMFKKAWEINPENEVTKHYLLICLQQNRKKDFHIEDKGSGYYVSSTVRNYRKLRDILIEKDVALICVEYPMRDIGELKSIIGEHKNVYFVDNKKSFKEALEREGYQAYFTDRFAEEFGHMTIKGRKLLSKNIADVLFKEYFNK